jgi:hypothetical protein
VSGRVGPARNSLEPSCCRAECPMLVKDDACSYFIACIMNSKVELYLFTDRLCLLNREAATTDDDESRCTRFTCSSSQDFL